MFEQPLTNGSIKLTIQVAGGYRLRAIELVIGPAGDTQLQTQGFQETACQAASRALEKALGLVTYKERTSEIFYATTLEQQRQAQS